MKKLETENQKLTHHIPSHFGPIRYLDKAPNSKNFLSASQDGSVKIYFISDLESTSTNVVEQKEQIKECNNKIFKRFGDGLMNSNSLINETNKMINLSWKQPKIKEQLVQNWIPGMPVPKDDKGLFGISNVRGLPNDLDDRLDKLKKEEMEQNSTIRITNLPSNIRNKDLLDLFDLYGRIEERGGIKIKEYPDSTMAFIKYVYPESAQKAIDNMDGYPLDYYIIKVELAQFK